MTGPTRLASRRSGAVVTLLLVVVTMTVGPLARGAIAAARADEQAATPSGYAAVAEADGVRTTTVAAGGPLTSVPVDVGSPVAQATFDSLGSSRAFASQAYPGDEIVTVPGTVAGVTNGAANLPHYPLIAQSDAPATPSSNVDAPGTSLRADSSSTESKASATSGAQSGDDRAGLTSSEAHIGLTADGAVTASAANDAEALTFGPLRLGQIKSTASVRLAPGSNAVKTSAFDATGVSVAGVAVDIGPGGITAGSSNTPLPATSPLTDVLQGAGVTVGYLAPQETPSGIVAAGLKVTVTHDVPGPISPVTVTYIFGQAAASVDGAAGATMAAAPALSITDMSSPDDVTGLNGGALPATAPASVDAAPASTSTDSPAPASVGPSLDAPVRSGPALAVRRAGARSGGATAPFDVSSLYLVVFGGAIVTAALSRLISLFGVKLRWIS